MATKVKPSRINVSGTPVSGQVPMYVDEDSLKWGNGTTKYGVGCGTASAKTKCVGISEIAELCTGQEIIVKTNVANTACATCLKLNDFDPYEIKYNNASLTSTNDSYVWGENTLTHFLFDGTNWQVVATSYDANTTYTMNNSVDAGQYKAGSGTYAITRYSLVMEKDNGTWEKITATNANYSTATTKSVNTSGFRLGHIRYYSGSSNFANGALVTTNVFSNKAATVTGSYSFNCGTAPGWDVGSYIYLVGTIGVDGLFYLDTTQWWTTQLPSSKDGKLYIRLGLTLKADDATFSLLENRPIYYYDNGIKVFAQADNKQDALVSGTNIKTINGCSLLGSGDICICGGGGGTGDMEKCVYDPNNCSSDAFDYCNFYNTPTIPTNNCQLANGCGYTTCTGTLSSCADVISALGYTPYSSANPCGYTTCTGTVSTCSDVISALGYTPYNATNPCGYTTCTGTLTSGDLACYACCCDIPTNNCQLTNGCGYTTCTGTVSSCSDIISKLGYTPYSNANPNGYTSCTGTLSSCSDIISALGYTPYSNANPSGYTSCTGTLVPSNIACINGCCLTNGGDICISGGISNDTTCTTTQVTKIWAGSEAEYACVCGSPDACTIYYVF